MELGFVMISAIVFLCDWGTKRLFTSTTFQRPRLA